MCIVYLSVFSALVIKLYLYIIYLSIFCLLSIYLYHVTCLLFCNLCIIYLFIFCVVSFNLYNVNYLSVSCARFIYLYYVLYLWSFIYTLSISICFLWIIYILVLRALSVYLYSTHHLSICIMRTVKCASGRIYESLHNKMWDICFVWLHSAHCIMHYIKVHNKGSWKIELWYITLRHYLHCKNFNKVPILYSVETKYNIKSKSFMKKTFSTLLTTFFFFFLSLFHIHIQENQTVHSGFVSAEPELHTPKFFTDKIYL